MSSPAYNMSDAATATAPTRMESSARQRILIAAGFALFALTGVGANVLPAGPAVDVAHGIGNLSLIMAGALWATQFARRGYDIVAVGFALLALATGVIVSGGTPADTGGEATFAGGTALYALALPLICLPAVLPIWTRVVGALAAVPFGVHALLWWLGDSPPSSGPFPGIGYMLLVVAVVGWIITVLRAVPSNR